jgi:hypothetical protein
MAPNKTQATTHSVDAFIAGVADRTAQADCRALTGLMSRVTGEPPVMWGSAIVGFGRYAYRYDSGRTGESAVVGFSPRKASLVLYIMPGFAEFEPLLARLGKHSVGKSCLYVKRLADIDMTVLEDLVSRSVEAMRLRYPVT